jgi:hypothetical protein
MFIVGFLAGGGIVLDSIDKEIKNSKHLSIKGQLFKCERAK